MSIFKEASKLKLRFSTSKGELSVEQLWDLSLSNLSVCIKNTRKLLNNDTDDDLSFLDETKVIDKTMQLRFDILKEVYLSIKAERDLAKKAKDAKEHNEKILAEIHRRQESSIQNPELTIEDLQKMLIS